MVEEQTESGFGTTVWAFTINGEGQSWEGKTIALAGSKGFLLVLALTKESTGRVLTVEEEYEYGEVEESGAEVSGGEAAFSMTCATTKTEN
jgi:hypothetical protein